MGMFNKLFYTIGAIAVLAMIFLGSIELYNRMRLSNEIRPIIPIIERDYDE